MEENSNFDAALVQSVENARSHRVPDDYEFETSLNKPARFRAIAEELAELYKRKNHDYGDSFGRSVQKYGPVAALTRLSDKFNRLENLILNGKPEVAESTEDTLRDMASYCIMTIMELKK